MYLFKSWKESLQFFIPKNFKLFFLVTLKTIYCSAKVWFTHFWWLIIVFISINGLFLHIPFKDASLVIHILRLFILFTMIASIRPSVTRKTARYFWSYKIYFIIWFLVAFFYFLLEGHTKNLYMNSIIEALVLYIALFTFFTLFFLDSRGGLRNLVFSFLRALKMAVYNYPFLCIISLIWQAIILVVIFIAHYVVYITGIYSFYTFFSLCNLIIGNLIIFSFFTNFYTKRLHDQFKLYFKE